MRWAGRRRYDIGLIMYLQRLYHAVRPKMGLLASKSLSFIHMATHGSINSPIELYSISQSHDLSIAKCGSKLCAMPSAWK